MIKTITLDNLAIELVEAVPELRSAYEAELEWWGDEQPGVHIIFGDLFNPYLISLLESDNQPERIEPVFNFLEKLANHEDVRVQELVAVTVCERLGDKAEWIAKGRQYMGKTTLNFSQEIEAFWGRDAKPPQNGKMDLATLSTSAT